MKSLLKNTMFAMSLSIGALIAVPTLSAQAAVPTDSSLMQLIKVTKTVEMMNDMTSSSAMTEQVMQGMLAALPNKELNKNEQQQYDAIISKYSKEIASSMDVQSYNQQIIDLYIESAKQHFNQQEVDAQVTFYSSEIGQSIINKQPAMMADYMKKITSQVMPVMMQASIEKMQSIIPRMQADIEDLMSEK